MSALRREDLSDYARLAQVMSVRERLERRFGLGTRPALRRQLYERLDELAEKDSTEQVYQLLCEVAADAMRKNDPGKYFAKSVMLRLRERRLLPREEL